MTEPPTHPTCDACGRAVYPNPAAGDITPRLGFSWKNPLFPARGITLCENCIPVFRARLDTWKRSVP